MVDGKLILKNTAALYIRAFVSLIVSLFTTRIILANLGVESYGVYQAVGGIVMLFSFLNISLSNATQRFISYYVGIGEEDKLKKLFTMAIHVHLIFSIIIVLIIEIFGIWYVKHEANFGDVQINAVYFVLHMSAIGLFFNINSVPYRGFLIAKEAMKTFAYIDLLSVFLKLAFAASLIFVPGNKLEVYALLMMSGSLIIIIVYKQVSNKKIPESKYMFYWDRLLFNKLLAFTGWTLIPAVSSILKGQGTILLLNSFFGPVLNASQGIANQVKGGIKTFSLNLLAAFSPQITITYAKKDFKSMKKLILSGAKITFYLFLFLCIPIMIERNYILSLWLIEVPEFASTIVLLVLMDTLISLMTSTFNIAIRATGKIKNYELTVNIIHILGFPTIFILLIMGFNYDMIFFAWMIFSAIALIIEGFWLNRLLPFITLREIYSSTLFIMLITGLFSVIVPLMFYSLMDESFLRLTIVTIVSFLSVTIFSYFLGLNRLEKQLVLKYLNKFGIRF
jgi:Na+-driven multidrug efflux pump